MRFASYQKEIEIEASTIEDAFAALVTRFPDLRGVLFGADGKLRSVHRVFCNGDAVVGAPDQLALGPTDEISLVTAIAGG
jgi:molybdopterin converting factor small subunit